MNLRDRKKERTRQLLSDTAIAMFLAEGFDRVAVADIAAAAEVSKPTLFRYFPAKEDLVLHRFADHQGELARVVAARDPRETPLRALHRHLRAGLEARDPVTGLCDLPEVLSFHRLVFGTPSLAARLVEYGTADAAALADALGGPTPRLVAAQVVAVVRVLAQDNVAAVSAGRTADEVFPEAAAAADTAFDLLSHGATSRGY
ncbi:TetR/AcrR family transcriptional regulator [Nonomuraea sp. NPDC059194]|uniref:TetR/AcrR family transcriptional regulator n=1 Tax=Nonomuraea sp. NPDC059194 TaxID=3346764 RepID=UPI0036B172A9